MKVSYLKLFTAGTEMDFNDNLQDDLIQQKSLATKSLVSKINTSISNFSVQYNFQSISAALLIMSASVCTSDDANCRDGHQAEWYYFPNLLHRTVYN